MASILSFYMVLLTFPKFPFSISIVFWLFIAKFKSFVLSFYWWLCLSKVQTNIWHVYVPLFLAKVLLFTCLWLWNLFKYLWTLISTPIVDISSVSVSILDLLSSFARACPSTFEAPPKEDLTYKTYEMCSIKKKNAWRCDGEFNIVYQHHWAIKLSWLEPILKNKQEDENGCVQDLHWQ